MATALAADVTGTWVAESEGRSGQPSKTVFEFKADGANLTGTMDFGMGTRVSGEPTAISEGKIDGDNISFVVTFTTPSGQEIKIKFNGKVTGDEIELNREMEGAPGGGRGGPGGGGIPPLIAKRQK